MDITNDVQLKTIIEQKAQEALEAITDEVLTLFKNEYVKKYVYGSHGANALYHGGSGIPTYQFLEAWEWTQIRRSVNTLATEMWYNYSKMTHDTDTYLHGSKYSSPPDVRNNLMDILNKDGYSSSLWLSVSRPVAYWSRFIEDLFSRGELEKIVEKHFISKGFIKV